MFRSEMCADLCLIYGATTGFLSQWQLLLCSPPKSQHSSSQTCRLNADWLGTGAGAHRDQRGMKTSKMIRNNMEKSTDSCHGYVFNAQLHCSSFFVLTSAQTREAHGAALCETAPWGQHTATTCLHSWALTSAERQPWVSSSLTASCCVPDNLLLVIVFLKDYTCCCLKCTLKLFSLCWIDQLSNERRTNPSVGWSC